MNILQSKTDLLTLDPKVFPEPLRLFAGGLLQSLEAEVDQEDRDEHLLRNPVILCDPNNPIISLLEASPFGYEYIEQLDLEGITAFRIGALLDNDWLAQYLIPADGMDAETMRWLEERIETGGAAR